MLVCYFRGFTNSYNYKKDHLRPFLKKQSLRIKLISCTIKHVHKFKSSKDNKTFLWISYLKSFLDHNRWRKVIQILTFLKKIIALESTIEEGIP